MFIDFEFGNYRSFRDKQLFSMKALPLRNNDHGLEEGNVADPDGLRLLKTKAIYGANGSGKSNFFKAVTAFCFMVFNSVKHEQMTEFFWDQRFRLITDWDEQPVFFQYRFTSGETFYRYGFQVLDGAVLNEWLFSEEDGKVKEEHFMRSGMELEITEESFPGAGIYTPESFKKNNELFRKDSLFLTVAALTGNKFAAKIRSEITKILMVDGLNDVHTHEFAMNYMGVENEKQASILTKLITAADTGIERLELAEDQRAGETNQTKKGQENENARKQQVLLSLHSVYDENGTVKEKLKVPFNEWESEGTRKLFNIGAMVIEALTNGRILLVDEFDARFHPSLSLKIVSLFNNPETNPRNAQLIFISHDTGLLRRAELRRDQISFVDKDRYGISTMRSLSAFKGVRKDASYEKEYLNGSYSAVPFLDEIDNIIMQNAKESGL